MEHLGIVRRSNSLWASPLHMVTKTDDGWCLCGDFCHLNNATTQTGVLSCTFKTSLPTR